MLLETNVKPTAPERKGTVTDTASDASPRERAWFMTRLERGQRERFVEVLPSLSPGLAKLMLNANVSNRAIAPGTVEKYAKIMKDGRWGVSTQGVAFATSCELIDGQHRLLACFNSGVSVPMTVWFGCDRAEFSLIDTGKNRAACDLLSIAGLDYHQARATMAQIELRLRTRSIRPFDPDLVRRMAMGMIGDPLDVALRAGHRAQKVAGVAAMSYTYLLLARSESARLLPAFWDGFVSGAGLSQRSPVLRVREYLLHTVLPRQTRERQIKTIAAVIIAWNAYVKNQTPKNFAWGQVVELPAVI